MFLPLNPDTSTSNQNLTQRIRKYNTQYKVSKNNLSILFFSFFSLVRLFLLTFVYLYCCYALPIFPSQIRYYMKIKWHRSSLSKESAVHSAFVITLFHLLFLLLFTFLLFTYLFVYFTDVIIYLLLLFSICSPFPCTCYLLLTFLLFVFNCYFLLPLLLFTLLFLWFTFTSWYFPFTFHLHFAPRIQFRGALARGFFFFFSDFWAWIIPWSWAQWICTLPAINVYVNPVCAPNTVTPNERLRVGG